MPISSWKRAIIIGASSGIGEALAQQLVRSGVSVALVARRESVLQAQAEALNAEAKAKLATAYAHDVSDTEAVPALFQKIVQDLGGLDLIIYAAGIMPRIAPNEYDMAKDRDTITTNFMGAVAWLNEAAVRFEKAHDGTIVGISSVAGDRGRRSNPVYNASKAALNCYLEALRNRIDRTGACVVTVKPGPVATPMTQGLGKLPGIISVEQAATEILQAAREKVAVAYIPAKWRPIMAVIAAIPSPIFKRFNL